MESSPCIQDIWDRLKMPLSRQGLSDLALQTFGPSPGYRELDDLGIPAVVEVLP